MKTAVAFAILLTGIVAPVIGQDRDGMYWAPKPPGLTKYVAPQRPRTKLADLLEKHKGAPDWREVIVDDDHLNAVYVSSAPGAKTPRRLHPDTREWWVVMDGQIRFAIEGQQPFVASKGWMVQVPYRTAYTLETIGEKPSLRFEVNVAHAKTLYPRDEKPPEMPGFDWQLVKLPQPSGAYERGNKPYIVFDAIARTFEQQPKKDAKQNARYAEDDMLKTTSQNPILTGFFDVGPQCNADAAQHQPPEHDHQRQIEAAETGSVE